MENLTRIALLQARAEASYQANLEKAVSMIREAAALGAKIVCTQELFTGYYFCQEENHDWFATAEDAREGPAAKALGPLARELGVVIISSIFERRMAGLYHNTAQIFDASGELLGLYRKMHIPDDPCYYEKFYFTPGDLGFRAWNTRHGKVGVLICWDQWYPEAARATALYGADVIFYPTAIGWHPKEKAQWGAAQHSAWETVQRGHSVANGCYVAAVNRIGHEVLPTMPGSDGIEFWGQSFVADPMGKVVASAAADEERVLLCDLDFTQVDSTRTHWPFLRDRRIDAYAGLLQRAALG